MPRPKLPDNQRLSRHVTYLLPRIAHELAQKYGSVSVALRLLAEQETSSIVSKQPLPAPIVTQKVKDTTPTTKPRKRDPDAKAACPAHTRLGKSFQPTCRQCLALN